MKFDGMGVLLTQLRFYRASGTGPLAKIYEKTRNISRVCRIRRAMTIIICYIKLYNVKSDNNSNWKAGASVDLVITEWALDAYLEHKHRNVFTTDEYRQTIRPDVE